MKKIIMFLAAALMVLVMGCASAGSQAQSAKSSDGAGKPGSTGCGAEKNGRGLFFGNRQHPQSG